MSASGRILRLMKDFYIFNVVRYVVYSTNDERQTKGTGHHRLSCLQSEW